MGFLNFFTKMVKGEPVFQAQQNHESKKQATETAAAPSHQGPKVIPQVYIENVECDESGPHMDVDVTIKNHSQLNVEVDKIEIFGRVLELDKNLTPGQEHEFRVFSGSRPASANANSCRLYYKTLPDGDYFCAHHTIEFKQESDRTYSVSRILFRPPVQDV